MTAYDAATVKAEATHRLGEIAEHLWGQPSNRTPRELRFGRKGSRCVVLSGSKVGLFADFEGGWAGDVFEAYAQEMLGCTASGAMFPDAVAGLAELLGIAEASTATIRYQQRPDPTIAAAREAKARAEQEKMQARARALWCQSQSGRGTLVERYLQSRSIKAQVPESLRFHPACWHKPTAQCHPAMIAAVMLAGDSEPVAIHRTFLDPAGVKAPFDSSKMMLGPVGGGAVRLSEDSGPLIVAEGIETALSLLDALASERPSVWAALSATGMEGLRLPERSGALVVAADGDDAGRRAACKLACAAHANGWKVEMMTAPEWADFNDVAMELAR
ncbi:MAG: toprim domain-containing protein [Pseudomonadota bacterium]